VGCISIANTADRKPKKASSAPGAKWVHDIRRHFADEELPIIDIIEVYSESGGSLSKAVSILKKKLKEPKIKVLAPSEYRLPPRRF
jgi:hypothetical protein